MKERILWVDSIKFIAIFLMVLGHAGLKNEIIENLICAFHIPLFFFALGLFIKKKKVVDFLKKDFKSLMQPYFLWTLLGFSICWISPYLHPELYPCIDSFAKIFVHAFYGMWLMDDVVTEYSFLPVGALWFLVALFISRVVFQVSLQIKEKYFDYVQFMIVILSVVLFFHVRQYHLFSFDSSCMGYPFVVMGYYFNKYEMAKYVVNTKKYIICLLGLLFIFFSLINGFVSVDGGIYGQNMLLYYLDGILGIILVIFLVFSFDINRFNKINYLGEHSLIILVFHTYVIIFSKVILTLLGFDVSQLPFIVSFVIALFCISIVNILVKPIMKYVPFMVGK